MTATEYLHSLSLDTSWLKDELGDVEGPLGWNGLIEFDREVAEELATTYGIEGGRTVYDAGEANSFTGKWGAALVVDSQGNKGCVLFDALDEADEAWDKLNAEAAELGMFEDEFGDED